ncbi:MAG: alpha/beta fold hydrolase, partial [Verrucomicrobia bacterium]|nr:alpha/beta fold hydrolase [Verrucomicrobiota bacterium]
AHSRPEPAEPIAIIGMSGRFPQSPDLKAFWEHLKRGESCISEVPSDRWDWRQFNDQSASEAGASASKWGGFIEGIDKFDARFFNISPVEAEGIDPQERLFLETAWTTLEDAGYPPELLSRAGGGVGVFVGVTHNGYAYLGATAWARGTPVRASSAHWSIANRVSYTLNFNGPSLALDTGCSSSLTAIHQACESLRRGECSVALAGGVHLIVHPLQYLGLSAMHVQSKGKETKSFGAGGDGFVDGEGVGAILLKPLKRALADGDHIHGVIKGSAINAGGRGNGYLVPNPVAQRELILRALGAAGVGADTISFIEANATGTELGDAVEMRGLVEAFSARPGNGSGSDAVARLPRCAVGSVKPNIGHLEAASGISAVIKVLLQFKHRQLVPLSHSDEWNAQLDLSGSPLYLLDRLADWTPLVCSSDNLERVVPRRAAVSSFGAGGANAHLILEEPPARPTPARDEPAPFLFTISAKTPSALRRRIEDLVGCLNAEGSHHRLGDISLTLNLGRSHFACRFATVASSLAELRGALESALSPVAGNGKNGGAKKRPRVNAQESRDGSPERRLQLTAMAQAYRQGEEMDWAALRMEETGRRIPLPAYPFEKKSYWVKAGPAEPIGVSVSARVDPPAALVVAPRNATDVRLIRVWEEVLRVAPIRIRDNFFQSGGTSLLAVRLMQEIEREFHQSLPLHLLFAASTVEALSDVLERGMEERDWTPLVPVQPQGSRTPLFLIPGWGGNIVYFHALGRQLGPGRPVYALQARGLEGNAPPYVNVDERMIDYLAAVKRAQPVGPYVLGGHSMGAHLAFELAQRLIKNGDEVARVVVMDKAAPLAGDPPETLEDEEDAWKLLYYTLSEIAGRKMILTEGSLQALSREDRIQRLRAGVSEIYGNPTGHHAGYMNGFLAVFFADSRTRYQPLDPVPVPILLLRAEEQVPVQRGETAGMRRLREDPLAGWQHYARGPVRVCVVPGNHNSILLERNACALATCLRTCLEESDEAKRHP